MKPRIHGRYVYCWARRRLSDGQPAPALPEIAEDMKVLSHIQTLPRYPLSESYSTAEEARAAREARVATIGVRPTPIVKRTADSWQLE